MIKKEPGVYLITNTVNGKVYVGSSDNIKRRRREHYSRLKKQTHCNRYLQRAFNKYGESSFIFNVICYSEVSEIRRIENELIVEYKSYDNQVGYNIETTEDDTYYKKESKKETYIKARKTRGCKRFKAYNKEGDFIGQWVSKIKCIRDLNLKGNRGNLNTILEYGHITHRYSIKGYYFFYADAVDIKGKISTLTSGRKPRTEKFIVRSKDQVVGTFTNQRTCARELDIDYKKISLCLKGTRKSHQGYTFNYV